MLIALCIISLLLLIAVVKLIVMKRSLSQVTEQFKEITSTDTNTVISVNSRDKDIRRLADELNKVLVDIFGITKAIWR